MGFFDSLLGGDESSSTTTNAPWGEQIPYYQQIFADARNLYNSGQLNPKVYPGNMIAPQSNATLQAQQGILNRAGQGSSLNNNAYNLASDTLAGNYLDVSKIPGFQQGLQDITDAYKRGTAAQTDSAAARAGAFGGSAYNELVGANNRAFSDSLNKFAGDIYNNERNRQLNTLQVAPSIDNLGYADLGRISGVGQSQDAYNQNVLNSEIDKFNTQNNSALTGLQNYKNLIGSPLGFTQTTTQSGGSNLLGNILGYGGLALDAFGGSSLFPSMFGGGSSNFSGSLSTPWNYATIDGLPWLN